MRVGQRRRSGAATRTSAAASRAGRGRRRRPRPASATWTRSPRHRRSGGGRPSTCGKSARQCGGTLVANGARLARARRRVEAMAKERLKSPRARLFVALDLPGPVRDAVAAGSAGRSRDPALRAVGRAGAPRHPLLPRLPAGDAKSSASQRSSRRSRRRRGREIALEPEPRGARRGGARASSRSTAPSEATVELQAQLADGLARRASTSPRRGLLAARDRCPGAPRVAATGSGEGAEGARARRDRHRSRSRRSSRALRSRPSHALPFEPQVAGGRVRAPGDIDLPSPRGWDEEGGDQADGRSKATAEALDRAEGGQGQARRRSARP